MAEQEDPPFWRSPVLRPLWAARRAWLALAVFTAAINLAYLAPMLYMLQVYDRVLTGRNVVTLLMLGVMVTGVYVLMASLEQVRNRVLVALSAELDSCLGRQVYVAAFRRRQLQGEGGVAQALGALNDLRQFLTGQGLFAAFDAPWAVAYLVVAYSLHPLLGVATMGAMGVLLALAWATEWSTRSLLGQASQVAGTAAHLASTSQVHCEAIQAMGMLPALCDRWRVVQRRAVQLQSRASRRAGVLQSMSRGSRMALQSGMLGLGAWLAIDNQISPGAIMAGTFALGRALAPVETLISSWKPLLGALHAWRQLHELLTRHADHSSAMALPRPRGELRLQKVSSGPPGQSPTLRDVSLHLKPGECLLVMGASGSGKSTLARVLGGVWPPVAGSLRLDGADLLLWPREQLGPYIGYLPQGVELLAGTVAQNIARFSAVDARRVVQAAQQAGAHETILALSSGYETQVGDGGSALSGGQRQRIGLARAMYGEPALLVLDEPDASLDEAGRRALMQSLQRARARGATVVIVSHHAGVLPVADAVLVLQGGRVMATYSRAQIEAQARATASAATAAAGRRA